MSAFASLPVRWLRVHMSRTGLSALKLGRLTWPWDETGVSSDAAKSRVKNILAGHQPNLERWPELAKALGLAHGGEMFRPLTEARALAMIAAAKAAREDQDQ